MEREGVLYGIPSSSDRNSIYDQNPRESSTSALRAALRLYPSEGIALETRVT